MSAETTIAVLMACYNRRESTVRAVQEVLNQQGPMVVRVFCLNDGSTDGTGQALAGIPGVQVHHGDGSLYWAASMARAEAAAMTADPDYFLWLNDDTYLYAGALEKMLQVSRQHPGAIIVGATRDPQTGLLSYGGRIRTSRWHPQRLQKLPVSDRAQNADTFNGNLVLVPRAAHRRVGTIDADFANSYADDDYGLRATAAGVPVIQAPGFLADCVVNPVTALPTGRGRAAWRHLQDPKGLPWQAQVKFMRRHGPWWWPGLLTVQTAARLAGYQPGDQSLTPSPHDQSPVQ